MLARQNGSHDRHAKRRSSPRATFASIVPVWILAAIGAVARRHPRSPPEERFGGLCLSLAVCALAAFCVQLAIRRREGFVARVTTSIVGAVVVTCDRRHRHRADAL